MSQMLSGLKLHAKLSSRQAGKISATLTSPSVTVPVIVARDS
jgi:hypothetical protein